MKLTLLGQIVVGGSIAIGGVIAPLLQENSTQQNNVNISENWIQLTLSQLSYYDGTNGKPAYVGFEGSIYDVTNASGWSNGMHEGMHLAGQDCTTILKSSPHGTGVLNQIPVIGEIVDVAVTSEVTNSISVTTSSGEITVSVEYCQWIDTDDAPRFSDDDDRDDDDDHDDHDDDDDDDYDDHDDDDDDDYDDDNDDGYWSCTSGGVVPGTSIVDPSSYPDAPASDGMYYLTLEQLAYYDGTNGKPAWVAVYGNIYDVTRESAWSNGVHRGMHLAGKDASSAFDSSPHSQSLLNSMKHIGYLI
jgi:predicted heme/steroid binding protein